MNIKELAKQAWGTGHEIFWFDDDGIENFAKLVAAAEREACAKLCEEKYGEAQVDNYAVHSAYDCAAVIRARENNNG